MIRDQSVLQKIKADAAIPFADISVSACQCYPCARGDQECICPQSECVLRHYINGENIRPMNQNEREWCLDEIGSVEGYRRSDYESYSDADLASTVLRAWVDYCRDKGLL